jgi:hypothetical protein
MSLLCNLALGKNSQRAHALPFLVADESNKDSKKQGVAVLCPRLHTSSLVLVSS